MEGQFTATAKNGRMIYNSPDEFEGYCRQFDGSEFIISCKEISKMSEKMRMYAYFNKPVLDATVAALTADGWTCIDKVIAEAYLKNACAKDIVYNEQTGEEIIVYLEKKDMTKARLLKFIVDCLHLLEERHNTQVMDGGEYKTWKETGERFKSVKFEK